MPVPSSSSNSSIVLFYKAVSQSPSGETTRLKFWFMPGREPNYGLVKQCDSAIIVLVLQTAWNRVLNKFFKIFSGAGQERDHVMLSGVKQSRSPWSNVCLLRNGVHEPGPSVMLHAVPFGGLDRYQAGASQPLVGFSVLSHLLAEQETDISCENLLSQFYEDEDQGQFS